MFTFKNVFAVGLFLFGTTFVWMTAAFTGRTPTPQGTAWSIENALALLAVVGFSVAAWGVYKGSDWWEVWAGVSAVVGLVAVVPYVVGMNASGIAMTDPGVGINLLLHTVGSGIVLAIVWLPAAHDWVVHRL
jgi:hypothetical protein